VKKSEAESRFPEAIETALAGLEKLAKNPTLSVTWLPRLYPMRGPSFMAEITRSARLSRR
jgi:hypothetical protein